MMILGNFLLRYINATFLSLWQPFFIAYQHRYLIFLLLKREITTRTAGTLLGDIWLFVQPGLQILGFWFLLDVVLKVKFPHRVPFVDYFLIGMLPWLFIAEILSRSLNVLTEFSGIYQRSIFPIPILPLLPILLSSMLYSVIMALVAGLLHGIAVVPIAIGLIFLIALWLIPFCYLLAVIGLFLKDIAQFFPFLITVTLYLTPILYMPQLMPEPLQWILWINPVADWMALIHAAIQGLDWHWGNVFRPVLLWLILIGPAWVLFLRAESSMREML